MFEALIYEECDRNDEHPESSLGVSETLKEAVEGLLRYIKNRKTDIYKVEIRKAE